MKIALSACRSKCVQAENENLKRREDRKSSYENNETVRSEFRKELDLCVVGENHTSKAIGIIYFAYRKPL